jgi:hypothetical protein
VPENVGVKRLKRLGDALLGSERELQLTGYFLNESKSCRARNSLANMLAQR